MTGTAPSAPSAAWLVAVPVLLALCLGVRPLRAVALGLAPLAALPGVVAAVGLVELAPLHWPWALLGTWLSVGDELARTALLFTSVLWLTAGLFARADLGAGAPRRQAFWTYWLATLAGNLGVVAAQDVVSFYLFFSLMTFASYGLILHMRGEEAAWAGRVYISMAILGETLLLAAFLLLAATSGNLRLEQVPRAVAASPYRDVLIVFLLGGFGVKAGMVPLHLWLPLAHPVAPTPASAVLSGALIKAGVLGWLRFLPLGEARFPALGSLCVLAGVVAAGGAALAGVTQRNPKTVLAYSSISQMGFLTMLVGVALSSDVGIPALMAAAMAYLTHHALAKGALFLGTGALHHARRGGLAWVVLAGLLWSGLEIAGAPLTSGALAKLSFKLALSEASPGPAGAKLLPGLLSALAVGSTLLMARFWVLVSGPGWRGEQPVRLALAAPWALLLAADTLLFLLQPGEVAPLRALLSPEKLLSAVWPVLLGLGCAAVAIIGHRRRGLSLPEVPAGDVLVPLVSALRALHRALAGARRALWPGPTGAPASARGPTQEGRAARKRSILFRAEAELGDLWPMSVVMVLWLGAMLLMLLR